MEIGKNRHNKEQFIASLEVEQQGYKHFPNIIFH